MLGAFNTDDKTSTVKWKDVEKSGSILNLYYENNNEPAFAKNVNAVTFDGVSSFSGDSSSYSYYQIITYTFNG